MYAKIIAAVFSLLLSSCSVVQTTYNHGPQLAWWWFDSYLDFNQDQAPHAKQAIHRWFGWHRSTQLPEYADWLADVHGRIGDTVTPSQVCQLSDTLQNITTLALDHAAQLGTPVILRLGEAQWRHLERRYAKSNDELRSDFLQPNPQDRLEASVKRTVKRIENLYGDIDEAQHHLIVTSIQNSPFNPEAWLAERQQYQQDILATLRRLVTDSAVPEHATTALRKLMERTRHSSDPEYRAYQLKLTAYGCDFIARMHNSTTPAQRKHAHKKLTGWETDFRVLSTESRVITALD